MLSDPLLRSEYNVLFPDDIEYKNFALFLFKVGRNGWKVQLIHSLKLLIFEL